MNSPQEIWQNQSAERNTMTLKLIEWKARDLRAKTRKKLLGTIVGPLAVGVLYGFAAKSSQHGGACLRPSSFARLFGVLRGSIF